MTSSRAFDPQRIVDVLARHEVQYVLIGAVAARLQGFPRLTADAGITPSTEPENLERLVRAMREDVIFRPLGTEGYEDLARNAVHFRVRDTDVDAASLADIIRCKRASDPAQDRADIPVLEAILARP